MGPAGTTATAGSRTRAATSRPLGDLQDQADKTQKKLDGANSKYGGIKGQIIGILGDFLGANDVKKCFGGGSISSCLWTAFDVGSLSFAALKIGRFTKAVKKSVGLWKKYNKGRKVITKAKKAANRAKSRLQGARKACGLPANSFTTGTPVLLADGHRRPIEDIDVGDRVRSVDPATGVIHAEPVTALIRGHGTKHLVRLRVSTAPYGLNSDTITATDNHPFWLANRHAWVDAGNLRPNDRIGDGHGNRTRILGRHATTRTTTAYNLTVADTHTYQIEAAGGELLVHNAAKRCNLPSYKKVKIDMKHIKDRHMKGGKTAKQSGKKNIFPETMSERKIQKTVKESYRNGKRVGSQPPDRVKVRGEYDGVKVEMWVNVKTKELETAYPTNF